MEGALQHPAIEIVTASKSFVKGERILKDVSFRIDPGNRAHLI